MPRNRIYSVGQFRLAELTRDIPRGEHMDWAIRNAKLNTLPYKGKGQRVGVLDTGCDINHVDLAGRVTAANFITGNKEVPAYADKCSHGTFCTGEIVANGSNGTGIIGAAPLATAFHGRVLYGNDKDNTRNSVDGDIAKGILACISEGCHVISMSLGGPGRSTAMERAIQKATDAGIIVVAAAGNERLEGSPYVSYPAGYDDVISVAAADKKNLPAWFSTVGRSTRLTAQPEIAIGSLEYYWGCVPGKYSYGKMIGTSMATPLFAGAALLWREAMETAAKAGKITMPTGRSVLVEFRKWIQRVANDTNKNGWDPELGYGVLIVDPGEL